MIDGQTLRRDADVIRFTQPRREARIEQLREHLAPRDARLLGIDEAYDEGDHDAVRAALLRTVGATFATATLLVTFSALALPAAAFA